MSRFYCNGLGGIGSWSKGRRRRRRSQRVADQMLAITRPSASNGAASAAALSSAAPPSSPVARIGFAKPPVVAVDLRRSSEVTPWVSGDWRIRLQGGAEVNLSRRYRQRFEALAPVRA